MEKIEELEKQVAELKLELTKPKPKKPERLAIGDTIDILNPIRGQERSRIVCKVLNNVTGRAIIATGIGKISRVFKSLKQKDSD